MGAPPWARFDDVVGGSAIQFSPGAEVLSTDRGEGVVPLLRTVEERTAAGEWAYGFVSYEAAPSLAAELTTQAGVVPLAWFAVGAPPRSVPVVSPSSQPRYRLGTWLGEWDETEHGRKVEMVRAHIGAGDTYQVNLTSRFEASATGHMPSFYADLATRQRARYNAYLDLDGLAVVSASPELFFELRGDRVEMRPMKGTAARGATVAEDQRLARRLVRSEKERAENVMIVDLVRNDLAKVAVTGGVHVEDLCRPERYPTVHQLTSRVTARLADRHGLVDVFRALFPCGSVTGAPKARTMEIIRSLETSARGVYCGAIGFVAPPGTECRARFSVAIRTAVIDRRRGRALYGTGGGITWDSEPGAEYRETLIKTRILDLGA